MSGRIVLHLDRGLGWTTPLFVAGCGDCGTELARSTDQAAAERAARRTRCPSLRHPDRPPVARHDQPGHRPRRGPRPAASPGRRRWPPARHRPPPDAPEGGESPCPHPGLADGQPGRRPGCTCQPKTVTRWASQGRLEHRRTLGGHRRYDPELIDALVHALTYRP